MPSVLTARRLAPSLLLAILLLAACAHSTAPAPRACPPEVQAARSTSAAAGPAAPVDPGSVCPTGACAATDSATAFRAIDGLDPAVNQRLGDFLAAQDANPGRKVAVFDGDGTTLGQTPHYLADECLFALAKREPSRKPDVIARMRTQSNVSLPYVQDRVRFLAGLSLQAVRALGADCYRTDYAGKIYAPMRALIAQLQEHHFEVWVITASPEALYQQFLAQQLGIPITHVVGVKSVVRAGIVTDEIVHPVPQDEGKREAIETFVQATPLLAAGNSRGDREMIELSEGLRIIVNPDEHVAEGDTESIADYAARNGWIVVRIPDVPSPGFPSLSSREFGIRVNKPHVPR